MEIQRRITIDAPPEKIWPYLVEPEKIMRWCITFVKFEYTGSKRNKVGTKFDVDEKSAGPAMSVRFKATEWVENESIAFEKISAGNPLTYRQKWTIKPVESGSEFTFWEEIVLGFGFLDVIIEPIGKWQSSGTVKKMLKKLKSHVEAEG
jgi:uncharacterized protein YndB with AHSA1/START domain